MPIAALVFFLGLILVLPDAAFAQEAVSAESPIRSFLVLWVPLILFFGAWAYLIRRGGLGKHRQVMDRSLVHMDRLEAKLDRIIELLERGGPRDPAA